MFRSGCSLAVATHLLGEGHRSPAACRAAGPRPVYTCFVTHSRAKAQPKDQQPGIPRCSCLCRQSVTGIHEYLPHANAAYSRLPARRPQCALLCMLCRRPGTSPGVRCMFGVHPVTKLKELPSKNSKMLPAAGLSLCMHMYYMLAAYSLHA